MNVLAPGPGKIVPCQRAVRPFENVEPHQLQLIRKAAERIREIDPEAKLEIETALFDFGWTKEVLDEGLADLIDQMGVHVYKELRVSKQRPEAVGTFIENGERRLENEQPYPDYRAEVEAYRTLLDSYKPGMGLWITETAANTGGGEYNVSPDSQAKFLARL
jgi:hypothetical protein